MSEFSLISQEKELGAFLIGFLGCLRSLNN